MLGMEGSLRYAGLGGQLRKGTQGEDPRVKRYKLVRLGDGLEKEARKRGYD